MGNDSWKDKPATTMQMAMVKALSNKDEPMTKGKATSIVHNRLRKIRKRKKHEDQHQGLS